MTPAQRRLFWLVTLITIYLGLGMYVYLEQIRKGTSGLPKQTIPYVIASLPSRCKSEINHLSLLPLNPENSSYVDGARPIDRATVSIISTILRKDKYLISGWVENLCSQQLHYSVEVLVLYYTNTVQEALLHAFAAYECTCALMGNMSVHLIHFSYDYGLYESWDMLIANYASGTAITNWNVDDRKSKHALAFKTKLLFEKNASVVSSAVFVTPFEAETYESYVTRLPATERELWFAYKTGSVRLSDFVKTDPVTMKFEGNVENLPHNAPLWKRDVHEFVGWFSDQVKADSTSGTTPSCADWTFWVNVCKKDLLMYHTAVPVEIYTIRSQSHNRRDPVEHYRCLEPTLEQLRHYGIFRNARFLRHPDNLIQKRVRVIHEEELTNVNGMDLRMRQIVSWLVWNNFQVSVSVRGQHWDKEASRESRKFLENLRVSLTVDDLSLTQTRELLKSGNADELLVMSLWFWRLHDDTENVSETRSIPEILLEMVDPASTVIVSDDRHSLRCKQNPNCQMESYIEKKEREIYERSSLVLTLSQQDKYAMQALSPDGNFEILPYASIEPSRPLKVPSTRDRQMRKGMLFIGSANENNIAAVKWLVDEVLPILRESIDISLTLLGAYEWKEIVYNAQLRNREAYGMGSVHRIIRSEHDPKGSKGYLPVFLGPCRASGVEIGGAEDYQVLSSYCQMPVVRAFDTVSNIEYFMTGADVIVAPISVYGSGISTKIFKGLEAGLPVVTFPNGTAGTKCEGSSCATKCGGLFISCIQVESFVQQVKNALFDDDEIRNTTYDFSDWLRLSTWISKLTN